MPVSNLRFYINAWQPFGLELYCLAAILTCILMPGIILYLDSTTCLHYTHLHLSMAAFCTRTLVSSSICN